MNSGRSSIGADLADPAGVQKLPYSEAFLERSWIWLQDPEIRRLTDTPEFTRDQQQRWFESLPDRTDYLIWGVAVDGVLVGSFGIKNIAEGTGEYWGYIGERAYWGRGVGQWMLRQAAKQARAHGLSQLVLRVIADNERARRAYERFGFDVETNDGEMVVMSLSLL